MSLCWEIELEGQTRRRCQQASTGHIEHLHGCKGAGTDGKASVSLPILCRERERAGEKKQKLTAAFVVVDLSCGDQ